MVKICVYSLSQKKKFVDFYAAFKAVNFAGVLYLLLYIPWPLIAVSNRRLVRCNKSAAFCQKNIRLYIP